MEEEMSMEGDFQGEYYEVCKMYQLIHCISPACAGAGVLCRRKVFPLLLPGEGDFFETSMDEGAQGGQASELTGESLAAKDEAGQKAEDELLPVLPEETDMGQAQEVMVSAETLCVDTKYVLEETDILYHTVVETTWRLPAKYVGMNREQFLQAMEVYEAFPPLSELERGFVGLEVLSFSRERVVVRMDYKFVHNKVVVYLEDMQTVYIETDIRLDSLPATLQQNIIDMMWIRDEEELYSFLENYSS